MSKPPNNYLQILLYLKQFEGDGLMHDVEKQFNIEHDQKISILSELAEEEYITLYGGYHSTSIYFGNNRHHGGGFIPAEAKITFKGSKYLKDELQMLENNKYNINIGDNSTANFIMHSPGSIIHNKAQSKENIDKIIESLQKDTTIEIEQRAAAIEAFTLLQGEVDAGNPTQDTWNKVLNVGANIASVGSLVLALAQQLYK